MMPLSFAEAGEEMTIQSIGGRPDVRQHLETLGFVPGGKVTVVSSINGNLIVNVKDTRVAVDKSLANKIMI